MLLTFRQPLLPLEDEKTYEKLSKDPTSRFKKKLVSILPTHDNDAFQQVLQLHHKITRDIASTTDSHALAERNADSKKKLLICWLRTIFPSNKSSCRTFRMPVNHKYHCEIATISKTDPVLRCHLRSDWKSLNHRNYLQHVHTTPAYNRSLSRPASCKFHSRISIFVTQVST